MEHRCQKFSLAVCHFLALFFEFGGKNYFGH